MSKIEPILADRDQQVQSVRSDATLAPKDRKAKVHGIRQDSDSRIEALLNDTQKQQYEQIKQSRKAKQAPAERRSRQQLECRNCDCDTNLQPRQASIKWGTQNGRNLTGGVPTSFRSETKPAVFVRSLLSQPRPVSFPATSP